MSTSTLSQSGMLCRVLSVLGAAAVAAVAHSSARAAMYTTAGGPIPDNLPGSPLLIPFVVTDVGSVAHVDLTLTGLTHTWAGDIIATLSGPGGVPVADIMRRPEDDTPPFSSVGDSSNFGGDYLFTDTGGALDVALGGGTSAFVVPSNTAPGFQASTRTSTTTGNVPVLLDGVFGGTSATGVWTLSISDNASLDTGSLVSATLNVVVVPEPATFGLCGVAMAGLLARRSPKR